MIRRMTDTPGAILILYAGDMGLLSDFSRGDFRRSESSQNMASGLGVDRGDWVNNWSSR